MIFDKTQRKIIDILINSKVNKLYYFKDIIISNTIITNAKATYTKLGIHNGKTKNKNH